MVSYEDAKAFLLQSDSNGANLYDHLSEVLLKLIEERPASALQNFENISSNVKASSLEPSDGPSPYTIVEDEHFDDKAAASTTKLFKSAFPPPTEGEEPPAPNEGDVADIVEDASQFEWAGVSLGREEAFRIALSIKQLVETQPLKSARFFGKVFGNEADYYIVESEFKEGQGEPEKPSTPAPAEPKDEDEEEEPEAESSEAAAVPKKDGPIVVPTEEGKGTNLYTYWVTTSLSNPWERLPAVTPEQITAARSISKFFTGRLDAKLNSYPPFPGTEANYLRAQIARIGAATVISPKGYYLAEEDEDSGEIPPVQVNADFEGIDNASLLLSANWVHHQSHILNQGRASFVSLKPPKDENEEEEEEDKPEEEEEQIETGPRLLTEISNDTPLGKHDAWTVRQSTSLSRYSIVTARSNRWPGAYAYANSVGTSVKFANIYVGFGLKYSPEPYSPPFPPAPQVEPPRPTETVDPTVAQEDELAALIKAQEQPEEEKEEGEEGEEGEEEEEEDE